MVEPRTVRPPQYLGGVAIPEIPKRSSLCQSHASWFRLQTHQVGFAVAAYDSSRPLVIDPVLAYSTYLGGNDDDWGRGIAVDAAGNVYVTGQTYSTDFPTLNPVQPAFGGGFFDAFVTKLDAAGSTLLYSTYLGGSGGESGYGIAVDPVDNAYVTG